MSVNNVRYCFVPKCINNSRYFPHIKFVTVPYTRERLSWFEAVGKPTDMGINRKTRYYCCEDHFNMDSDSWTYEARDGKLVIKIKPGILPTPSRWTPNTNLAKSIRQQMVNETNTKSTQTDYTICNDVEDEPVSSYPHCNIKEEDITEPDKSTELQLLTIMPQGDLRIPNVPESLNVDNNSVVEFSLLSTTLLIMNRRPKHYMGVNDNSLHVLLHLTKVTHLPEEKIMLTLRKIRLNEEFQTLADLFDIAEQTAEEYFNNSLLPLSSYLQKFMKYITPKLILTKQLTTVGIHIQRCFGGKTEFDLKTPHIILDSKLVNHIREIVQIVIGLANLQKKLIKTTN